MTRRLPACVLAALALASAPATAIGQQRTDEAKKPTISADGTEVFQYLLDRARIKPIKASQLRDLGPRFDDVIVIVLGDANWPVGGQSPILWVDLVLRNGGAALVASDTYLHFGNFFHNRQGNPANVYIPRGMVYCNDRASVYLNRPNLPFVVPFDRPAGGGPEWDLFTRLKRIATNRPSCLIAPRPSGEFESVLAGFPKNSLLLHQDRGRASVLDPDNEHFALGSSGPHPDSGIPYRFLAMADPSVFINAMMIPTTDVEAAPDNLAFAGRVVSFLSEEDGQKTRTRCLFIQNGQVVERFDSIRSLMQPPIPLPSIDKMQEKLVDAGNQILDKLQENNAHNRLLLGGDNPAKQSRILRGLVGGLLFIACLWIALTLLFRTWGARRPTDAPAPPPGGLPTTPRGDRPAGVFDRRQRELLRRNNLYEPVRGAVREMFASAGAPADAGRKLPKVIVADALRRADTLREALADLWKIAYGPPRVVTVQRWSLLEPLFERVRQAHAEGKWRFVAVAVTAEMQERG